MRLGKYHVSLKLVFQISEKDSRIQSKIQTIAFEGQLLTDLTIQIDNQFALYLLREPKSKCFWSIMYIDKQNITQGTKIPSNSGRTIINVMQLIRIEKHLLHWNYFLHVRRHGPGLEPGDKEMEKLWQRFLYIALKKKKSWCGTHATLSYFALQKKTILLSALHSQLIFIFITL